MERKNTKIYILCGKARSGKDTSASFINEYCLKNDIKIINLQFSSYLKDYAKKITNWDGSDETKPRSLLQTLGTDIIRKDIDDEFFVKKMIDDIKVYSYFFDVITISDARFKIEVDKIKEMFDNVIAINIVRPNFDNGLTEEQKHHATEVDLDDYKKFDYEIINDQGIDELREKIENLIEV